MTIYATHSVTYYDDDDCPWKREFYITPYRPATLYDPAEGGIEVEAHYRDGILWTDELPPDVDFGLTVLADEYVREYNRDKREYDYDAWRDRQMEKT